MASFTKTSFWLDNLSGTTLQTSQETAIDTDVVVIGAGVTGASTAYHLSKSGVKCMLVERRCISGGATGRNGGFIVPGIAGSMQSSLEKYGADITKKLHDYSMLGTLATSQFIVENQIDCEMRTEGCVYLAVTEEEVAALGRRYELLLSTHCNGSFEWWDESTCAQRTNCSNYKVGMLVKDAGNLWPAKMVTGMVQKAVEYGTHVQTHTEVLSINRDTDIIMVETSRGCIRCRNVVHCTNAWVRELIPSLENIIIPVRNQVIITAPLPRLWTFAMNVSDGHTYFMQRPDGRVVLGGMRKLAPTKEVNSVDENTQNMEVSTALRSYIGQHFKEALKESWGADSQDNSEKCVITEQEWIGIMGFSADENPLVGPLKNRPGEYIAAGFTGHGMPFGFLAGKNISEMIRGEELPDYFIPEALLPDRFGI